MTRYSARELPAAEGAGGKLPAPKITAASRGARAAAPAAHSPGGGTHKGSGWDHGWDSPPLLFISTMSQAALPHPANLQQDA